MIYVWDEIKRTANIEKHGIDFVDAVHFDWQNAQVIEDTRQDYSEKRFTAMGTIFGRLCVLVFTTRGEAIRVISLRKANTREGKRYEKVQKTSR